MTLEKILDTRKFNNTINQKYNDTTKKYLKKQNCCSISAIVVFSCNKILQIFKFVDVETSSGVTCFHYSFFSL
jgi:hypothetical protein